MPSKEPIYYFSVRDLARRYNNSPATVWRWVAERDFPRPVRLSRGCTRWRLHEVEAWEAARQNQAAQR